MHTYMYALCTCFAFCSNPVRLIQSVGCTHRVTYLTHSFVRTRIDFCSIPQLDKSGGGASSGDAERQQNDLIKAVNSIPAYIERCTHFFAVCPTIQHKDRPDAVCDFGSWLRRAWCNLELYALQLARFGELPAIVVQGGAIAPYLMAPVMAAARLPGHGELTCCARNHVIRDAEGVEHAIPCDRFKIGEVLATMLTKRQTYHLGRAELDSYRMWRAATPMVLSALPAREAVVAAAPRDAAAFRRAYRLEADGGSGAS